MVRNFVLAFSLLHTKRSTTPSQRRESKRVELRRLGRVGPSCAWGMPEK